MSLSEWHKRNRERLQARGICGRCRGRIGEDGTRTMCRPCARALALAFRVRYAVRNVLTRLEKIGGGKA